MSRISLSSGVSFDCADGSSILDAALLARVPMGYSCRTGRCSSCKCRVVSGESQTTHDELGLSVQEKEEGWILGCVRTPASDMELEVEDLGVEALPPIKTLPCRIHSLEKLAPDIVKVVLRLPPTAQFDFLAGQYVDMIGPDSVSRSYSLAAADATAKLLELHIREVPGGVMSAYWFGRAKENDLLRLKGPLGTFFLRDVTGVDVVFLATGTGIAPVKAMLEGMRSITPDRMPRSVTVFWGARVPDDLYWDVMAVAGPHTYVPVLSRAGDEWHGARGHVQDALLATTPDLANATVYACGSEAMIHSSQKLLVEAGLPKHRFFSDAFVCSAVT